MGWTHSYAPRLASLASGSTLQAVRAFRPNGAVQTFTFNGTAWVTDADIPERLAVTVAEGVMTSATYTRADDTVETYDGLGKLVSLTNRDGYTQQLSYVAGAGISPNVQTVTDPEGRVLRFTYSAEALVSVTDPAGGVIQYAHTGGNLVSVGYPLPGGGQALRTYHYNESGQTGGVSQPHVLTGITDEDIKRYASWGYDANRRGTLSVHGPFASGTADRVSLVYTSGGTSQVTDSLGTTRSFGFLAQHRVARLTGLDKLCPGCTNVAKSKTYDSNGMPDKTTDFAEQVTDTDYNARLLQSSLIEASTDTDGYKRTTQTDWHPSFRVPAERRTYNADNVLVVKTNWTHNTRGQALTVAHTDPISGTSRTTTTAYCEQSDIDAGSCPRLGLITSVDGPRTDVSDLTTYTYYPADDATCASAPTTCPHRKGDLWKVTNALGQVTETLKYDGAGRALSVKDANGVVTDYEYHPRGWLTATKVRGTNNSSETDDRITRIEYWPTGLVKKVTQPDGTFTGYVYDNAHRLTDISDKAGNTIHYVLDNAGNRVTEETKDNTGALKRTLSRIYNQLGQLETQADSRAYPTDYTYDANGNADHVTDALERSADNDHDPLNRLKLTLQDVGGIAAKTEFEYDALDNLTKVTDPKGLDTTYDYNGLGDLNELISPDTGTTSFTYDSAGNRATQTGARGELATFTYDALNRLINIGYSTASLNVINTYDVNQGVCPTAERFPLGRLTKMKDGSGTTQYCYDRFGQLVRKVQTTNGKAFTLRYAYTKGGRLKTLTYPDGIVMDYVRNTVEEVTEVGITKTRGVRQVVLNQASYLPFGPVKGWMYGNGRQLYRSHDQDYRPTAIHDAGVGGLDLGFAFDPVGNLGVLSTATNPAPQVSFGYDDLNRLTQFKDGPTQTPIETYTYDKTGNRKSFTNSSGTQTYTYPGVSHRLSKVGAVSRSYDAAGNTKAIGGTARQFVYDTTGRMSQAKQGGAVVMNYRYNARGERVRKYLGAANTYTLYDEAGRWLGDYDTNGAPLQQAIWLDDLPVGLLAGSTQQLHYVEPDHLGTPRVVIDPLRNVAVWAWNLKSEAFGNSPPNQNPDGDGTNFVFDMRLPGQRYDAASGLNYNYFRDYDPGTGRYVQSDPIGLMGGISTYAYTESNPLIYFDADGLRCSAKQRVFLQIIVNVACKWSGNRRCTATDSCSENQAKISRNSACIAARTAINQKCFGGGDSGHKQAVEEAKNALKNCMNLRAGCCAGEVP